MHLRFLGFRVIFPYFNKNKSTKIKELRKGIKKRGITLNGEFTLQGLLMLNI